MTIAIYGLAIMAVAVGAIGLWEAWRALRTSREYYKALHTIRTLRDSIADAEKRHAKRSHLHAELKQKMADMLRLEGRMR